MVDTVPDIGCFSATPPETVWHQVPCKKAPQHSPMVPAIVGGGGRTSDYMIGSAGLLTAVWGSFNLVSGGSGQLPDDGLLSLQVNSNTFLTPACNGSPNPNCRGWQQFVTQGSYWPDYYGDTNVFMEYWLLSYDTYCPDGWTTYYDSNLCSGSCCYKDSYAASGADAPSWDNLDYIRASGQIRNGGNVDYADYWDGHRLDAVSDSTTLWLSRGWTSAEFNIFGINNGARFNFPSGTTLGVRMGITDTTGADPRCGFGSTTGETNNLTLNTGGCGATNGIGDKAAYFMESNVYPPPATCR